MADLREIEARLLAPGAPFELTAESVLGERMEVFRQRPRSLRELLAASAAHGDAEFIVCGDRRIGYAEHLRRVASVARALEERFGVGPGDRVAICGANCAEWIISFWATVSLGAVAVGLNGWWSGEEIVYGVEHSDPRVLLGDRRRLQRIPPGALRVPVVEFESGFGELEEFAPDAPLPEHPIEEDAAATILYTSGTTGRPKGAVNTHRGVVGFTRLSMFHGLRMMMLAAEEGAGPPPSQERPCMLVNTPLFHVSGLYSGAVTALASGLKTVWMPGRFDPGRVLEIIERERVTSWGPMGTMLYRVVHHPDVGRRDLSSLRQLGSGGAPLSPELQELARKVFPNARASLGLGYGLTESTGMATVIHGRDLEERPSSVGRALPTVQLEIRDERGRALPPGAEGEIHIRGPLVMREYWRDPDATAEALRPGRWLRTGDIGHLDEDGYLFVNSRARDLILRGGENIYPAEVEHALEAHPEVAEAAVFGVDHPEYGQVPHAVAVPVPGAAPEPEELRRFVGSRLAAFKVPVRVEIRRTPLPRNAAGKVLKDVLRAGGENPFVEE